MRYTYYGVKGDFAWQLDWHNSWLLVTNTNSQPLARLVRESDQVWVQGPRGGVRICHHVDFIDWSGKRRYGYIKQDSEAMKEFAWIKLKARSLNTKLWG